MTEPGQPAARLPSGITTERVVLTAIGLLTFLGLLLRGTQLGIVPYNIDEAIASIYANQLANLRMFHWSGVRTSQGFHNPPLFIHMLTPFFAVTPDPRFAGFGMAMLGSAAIPLAGLAARRLSGNTAALFVATLIAFSPNAIEHSRRLWGHDTIIFFSALAIYAALRATGTDRARWWVVSAAACIGAMACHLSGALLLIVPIGMLLTHRTPWWRRAIAGATLVFAFIYAPWLIEDAGLAGARRDDPVRFQQFRLVGNLALGRASLPQADTPVPAWQSWSTVTFDASHTDLVPDFPPGPEEAAEQRPRLVPTSFLGRALAALLALGGLSVALASIITHRRKGKALAGVDSRWAGILAATALAPLALFTLLPLTTVPPYQLPALVPLLLLGGMTCAFLDRGIIARGVIIVVAILFAITGMLHVNGTRAMASAATPGSRIMATLDHKLDAVIHITDEEARGPFDVRQNNRSHDAGVDYWVLYLGYRVTRESVLGHGPDSPVLFLIIDDTVAMGESAETWLADKPQETFGPIRVYRLTGNDAQTWRRSVQ